MLTAAQRRLARTVPSYRDLVDDALFASPRGRGPRRRDAGLVVANEVLDCLAHHKILRLAGGPPMVAFVVPSVAGRAVPRRGLAAVMRDPVRRARVRWREIALPLEAVPGLAAFCENYVPEAATVVKLAALVAIAGGGGSRSVPAVSPTSSRCSPARPTCRPASSGSHSRRSSSRTSAGTRRSRSAARFAPRVAPSRARSSSGSPSVPGSTSCVAALGVTFAALPFWVLFRRRGRRQD